MCNVLLSCVKISRIDVACAFAGTYKTADGSAVCTLCVAGKYREATAQTSNTCLTCPIGTNSPAGSGALTLCTCNAGWYGPDGAACTVCPVGKYKPTQGAAECTLCPAGTWSGNTQQTSNATCTACDHNADSAAGSDEQIDCKCNRGWFLFAHFAFSFHLCIYVFGSR